MTKMEAAVIERLEHDTLAFFGKRNPQVVVESDDIPLLASCVADLKEVVNPPTLENVMTAIKDLNNDVNRLAQIQHDLDNAKDTILSAIKELSVDLYYVKSRLGM